MMCFQKNENDFKFILFRCITSVMVLYINLSILLFIFKKRKNILLKFILKYKAWNYIIYLNAS